MTELEELKWTMAAFCVLCTSTSVLLLRQESKGTYTYRGLHIPFIPLSFAYPPGTRSLASRCAALFLQWAFHCGVLAVGSAAASDWSAPSRRVGFFWSADVACASRAREIGSAGLLQKPEKWAFDWHSTSSHHCSAINENERLPMH